MLKFIRIFLETVVELDTDLRCFDDIKRCGVLLIQRLLLRRLSLHAETFRLSLNAVHAALIECILL